MNDLSQRKLNTNKYILQEDVKKNYGMIVASTVANQQLPSGTTFLNLSLDRDYIINDFGSEVTIVGNTVLSIPSGYSRAIINYKTTVTTTKVGKIDLTLVQCNSSYTPISTLDWCGVYNNGGTTYINGIWMGDISSYSVAGFQMRVIHSLGETITVSDLERQTGIKIMLFK